MFYSHKKNSVFLKGYSVHSCEKHGQTMFFAETELPNRISLILFDDSNECLARQFESFQSAFVEERVIQNAYRLTSSRE